MGLVNIKKYMKDAGLQSKEVADKMNVRPETVSRWVSGINNPGLDQAEQLAEILGVSISDILFKQRGMRVAGTRNYHGEVTFFDSMEEKKFIPIPGHDCPPNRFCLMVDTHQQEDESSFDTYSDKHIKEKTICPSCYTMRSLVKIKNGPHQYIGKIMQGILFPNPNATVKNTHLYSLQRPETKEVIVGLELEWATPLISRFYNQSDLIVLDIEDMK